MNKYLKQVNGSLESLFNQTWYCSHLIAVVPSCNNITKHAMHHVGTGSTLVGRDGVGSI